MIFGGGDQPPRTPWFDVVLRGYDRRQVDEYVALAHAETSRLRSDLERARRQQAPPPRQMPMAPPRPGPPPGGSRPAGPPPGPQSPGVIDSFTDRMQAILRSAEKEAADIRARAHAQAQFELAELERERAALAAEVARLRDAGQRNPDVAQTDTTQTETTETEAAQAGTENTAEDGSANDTGTASDTVAVPVAGAGTVATTAIPPIHRPDQEGDAGSATATGHDGEATVGVNPLRWRPSPRARRPEERTNGHDSQADDGAQEPAASDGSARSGQEAGLGRTD